MPQIIPQIVAIIGAEEATGADVGVTSTLEDTGVLGALGLSSEDDNGVAAEASVDTGASVSYASVEEQAAQRRLARLSKYFTSPSGVLDSSTGSSGVL